MEMNPVKTVLAGKAGYVLTALAAIAVFLVTSWLIGIGMDRQKDKQEKADKQVENIVDDTLTQNDGADEMFDAEKIQAEEELEIGYTKADIELAYQRGVTDGLRETRSASIHDARRRGGCLVVPYDADDGLLHSAGALQERFRQRGSRSHGAGPDQRDVVRETPGYYPLAGAGPAGTGGPD